MFSAADTDGDGQLSFAEFSVMVTPPAPPEIPRFTLQTNVQTVLLHNNAVNMNISQKIQKILIFYSIHNPYIPLQLQTRLSDVLTGASSKVKMWSVDIMLVWMDGNRLHNNVLIHLLVPDINLLIILQQQHQRHFPPSSYCPVERMCGTLETLGTPTQML